jgi:hypothetical protein
MLAIPIDYPKPLSGQVTEILTATFSILSPSVIPGFSPTTLSFVHSSFFITTIGAAHDPYTHASPEALTLSISISECRDQIPRKHGGGCSRHYRMRSSREGDSELAEVLLRILGQVF